MSTITLHIQPPVGQSSDRECRDGAVTFGRAVGADVVVTDGSMSRNGTFVNGDRIEGRRPIAPGDVIKMGATIVRVSGDAEEPGHALGSSDLASSIFRSVAEIANETLSGQARPALRRA